MRTNQGKAILVIANRLHRNSPALDRVTRFAIGSELAAMQVCMTIRAFLADVRKHQLYVALRTSYFFMHAAQRILCAVVIKFRNAADWPPAQRCVAIFAGNVQRAVRVSRSPFWHTTLRRLAMDLKRAYRQNEQQQSSTKHVGILGRAP